MTYMTDDHFMLAYAFVHPQRIVALLNDALGHDLEQAHYQVLHHLWYEEPDESTNVIRFTYGEAAFVAAKHLVDLGLLEFDEGADAIPSFTMAMAGLDVQEKAIDVLAQACAIVRKQNPDAGLIEGR